MIKGIFNSSEFLTLESGDILHGLDIAYTTQGKLNADKSNVVWVVHALTGDAHPEIWWKGIIGDQGFFDAERYFIVCANLLGSPYGSTSPLSLRKDSGEPFYSSFPPLTTRDMANSLDKLREHLQLTQLQVLIGGSLGGQVALEWSISLGSKLGHVIIIAASSKSSPWLIGFNQAQRMAISSDSSWGKNNPEAGSKGLMAARAMAMLSYRNPEDLNAKQKDNLEKLDGFLASSYLSYQGEKLAKRFNAFSYWTLTKTMDSHDVGRSRGGIDLALQSIQAKVLAIGINSDLLFLAEEVQLISQKVSQGVYKEIKSTVGHDAFLVEFEQLKTILSSYFSEKITST
ncbi:MAG: homoserine O-acetyltransferase [Algoriphagus sp.]|jgi:homoserine O-acetyltransferase|nr:homoserine O-acetyltransferase [Algoriphagus sp.]